MPFVLAVAGLAGAVESAAQSARVELVTNGGIEFLDESGRPAGWRPMTLRGAKATFTVDRETAHSGRRSLKIDKPEQTGYAAWCSAYIHVDPAEETDAELSVWVKAEDCPWLMVRVITRDQNGQYHQYLTPVSIEKGGFFDWTECRQKITLKPGDKRVTVHLVQPHSGTVWFDDVKLTAGKGVRATRPSLTTRGPAGVRPPQRTQSTDVFECRNYIKNTRMVGPVGSNGLPLGWSVHNPPQEETIGEVSWIKGDPRPGYYSIRVTWLDGGRYIAAEPELVRPVVGRRPLGFRVYVKTADGGAGYLLVQCLNSAGQVIGQSKSDVVRNAKDYVTAKLGFVTHPDTARVRAYCVNGGTGKVWFHWAVLEPDMDAVKTMAAFPYTVSCEPAEGNRFWNGGEAVLHSFEDSPVSASFAFWGDKSRLDRPALIVDVPRGLTIAEAFNMNPRAPVCHERAEPTRRTITREGAPHVRHVFPGPDALKRMRATPYLYNHLTMCFLPDAGETRRSFRVYYRARNGDMQSDEKHFTLRILPAMERTPNPKRFQSHLWTVDDINFYDLKLVVKAARRFEEAALAGRERWTGGREDIHRVDQLLKSRGWFLFHETGDYVFRRSKARAVDGDGKPSTSARHYCPTNAVTDASLHGGAVLEVAREQVQNARTEDGEFVFLDYEPGSVARRYCFCDLCRRTFASKFGIPFDRVQTRRDILLNYAAQWGQYWAWLCDSIIRRHVEAYRTVNPNLKHFLYCYPIWFNDPEATATKIFNSPLDTRLNQKHMDRLGLSFYHISGKTALDMLDVNTRTLEKPCYMMPLMGTTTPYWGNFTEDEILSPAGMRQQVLIAATSGAAGVIPYQGKLMDGMYFLAIDRAMAEIAACEEFYMDGERVDERVSLTGLPTGKVAVSEWKEHIGVRAHQLGQSVLLTIFNFHRQETATLKVAVSGLAGRRWSVADAVSERAKAPRDGRRRLTAREIAGGLPLSVQAEDVVLWRLVPE